MQCNSGRSLQRIILDEIALEGLEGVTLPSLWIYLGATLNLQLPLPIHLVDQVWQYILKTQEHLEFFLLPKERENVQIYERFKIIDVDLGVPITPDTCPLVRYTFVPIMDGPIMGSCESYKERQRIPFMSIKSFSADQVLKTYGSRFVIVASQTLRYNALTPENVPRPKELTAVQYAIWEAIGRSRRNGETSAGLWSLLNLCKDSATVFYIKNKLLGYNVISSQVFNEKRGERLIVSTLLTLPRFHPTQRSTLMTIVEKMFLILKDQPHHRMPILDMRMYFAFDNTRTLKKVMLTHLFRRIFETQSVCYFDIHTNAKPKSVDPNTKRRTVAIVKLRNPECSIDDLFTDLENDSNNTDESEITSGDFHVDKHAYVDMPLREELYQCVARFGSRGASNTEINCYMASNYLTLRQIIKQSLSDGLIKAYVMDKGRQRLHMYVALEHSDAIKKTVHTSNAALKNLQCNDEPNLPKVDVILSDIPQIVARIKEGNYEEYLSAREGNTQKLISRKAIVVQVINENCIASVVTIRKAVHALERSQGATDVACRKTLARLLCHMNKLKIINLYEIILQCEEQVRLHRYVTHPKIDVDHRIMRHEILKLKNAFFLAMEEKRLRQVASMKFQKKQFLKRSAKIQKDAAYKSKDVIEVRCQKPPKFLISRYIHEFLFYIVIELSDYRATYDVTPELLQYWQQSEPSLNITEYYEQSRQENINLKAYSKEISWRTFIPPLPNYADKPVGWVCFTDAVDRMPLSIFNKVFRLDKGADKRLSDYLAHPIRQHYLMRQLPADLQCKIMRIQLQRVYISVLKLMNQMGLIQISDRLNVKDPLVMWVYFNRKACILDTTTSEMSYNRINSEREYVPIYFNFSSFDDVHHYWTTLQRICVYTKLGYRRGKRDAPVRAKQLEFLSAVDFDEAPAYDNGRLPGDGLGAAGLSSTLFAHTFRNWSWSIQAQNVTNVRTGRTAGTGTGVKRMSNKTLKLNRRYRKMIQIHKDVASSHSVPIIKYTRKKRPLDAIDKDALKNMRTLRVHWSTKEDELLLVAKTVYVYLSPPVASLGLIDMGKVCRDVIRHTLGINNKTTQACTRRIRYLVHEKRHIPHVPTWLHILQTDERLQTKYGDKFLEKLRKVYPTRSEAATALMRHFTLIMVYMYKLIYSDDKGEREQFKYLLPNSIVEFESLFVERNPVETDEDMIVYKDPETVFDVQVATVINVLHSSLCSIRDKTLFNLQAFDIYKSFSEDVLEAAFAKARADAMVIAIKRKNLNLLPTQMTGPQYLLSSKYRSRLLWLRLPYSVFDAFYSYYGSVLHFFFGASCSSSSSTTPPAPPKDCMELKSPTLGQMFVIAESVAQRFLCTNIKLPINMLTVDAEQSSMESSIDRTLDHFQNIFENAPETEYTKNMEVMDAVEKSVRVKFRPANLSYKLHYTPYDFIAKLPARNLHFFCALNHLNKDVDIHFDKLQQQDQDGYAVIQCPFPCILLEDNYLNAIARIVMEKGDALCSLSEIQPQKLLYLATNGQQVSVKVDKNNLLTLVRMLESYWHDKESTYERKDLGKMVGNLKMNKPVDWCQLCQEILVFQNSEDDYDKIEEYEPTLNKEERIVRAQDVFVVNLPTIQIKMPDAVQFQSNTTEYDGLRVPEILLEMNTGDILQRIMNESLWQYTNNDLVKAKLKAQQSGFNDEGLKCLEEVHNYVQNHTLGVSVRDLMNTFSNEKNLPHSLDILSSIYVIKRVGIRSFLYVHKNHIRAWVVHTFNLKRLERENIGGATAALKRQYAKMDSTGIRNEGDASEAQVREPVAKKFRSEECTPTNEENVPKIGKRIIKPVKRFESVHSDTKAASSPKKEREIIVIRPVPWIRLNGSMNRRVLDRWLGSILSECVVKFGCTVCDICLRFPHMLPVDIMLLIETLGHLKCIQLYQTQHIEVDLFSEYKPLKECIVTSIYDPEITYIRVQSDAIMRLSLFIGNKKYKTEFI